MPRSARLRLLVPVAACSLLFGLAACGDDTSASDEPSSTPASSAADAPSELVLKVLKKGSGAVVKSGDSVTVDYQGTNWTTNTVFDQSYGREPATFATNAVVPGFGAALVGQTVGSQVVVAIPPEFGYGEGGQASAGISGTDTLVFVIEIKAISGLTNCKAKPGPASNSVSVAGQFGKRAVPKFAKKTSVKSLQRTILKAGKGARAGLGDDAQVLLSIYNARTGKKIGTQPTSVPLGNAGVPASIAAGVECVKQGSRVVTVFPATDLPEAVDGSAIKTGDSLVLVTDVIKVAPAPAPTPLPETADWTDAPEVEFDGNNPPTLTLPTS